MKKILCYVYENMADFEIVLTLHCLRNKGEIQPVMISENREPVTAQSGMRIVPDLAISGISEEILAESVGLLIPGGPISPEQNEICPMIRRMAGDGKLVAAMCFAPQFLGRAGILNDHKFTASCGKEYIKRLGCEDPFVWENFENKRLVVDGNVLTAQGNAFVDAAEKISEILDVFPDEGQRTEYFRKINARQAAPCQTLSTQ